MRPISSLVTLVAVTLVVTACSMGRLREPGVEDEAADDGGGDNSGNSGNESTPVFQIATGQYVGSNSTHAVSGLPFTPDVVWIKPGYSGGVAQFCPGSADGFTAEEGAFLTMAGVTYFWVALKGVEGRAATGSTVDGFNTLDFAPELVMSYSGCSVLGTTQGLATPTMSGGVGATHNEGTSDSNPFVSDLTDAGFFAGVGGKAFLALPSNSYLATGSYVGAANEASEWQTVEIGFEPQLIVFLHDDGIQFWWSSISQYAVFAGHTLGLTAGELDMSPGAFRVAGSLNTDTRTFHWVALGDPDA